MNNTPQKLWFRRKTFGWGWTPCSWEGWVVTLVYTVTLVLLVATLNDDSSTKEIVLIFILPLIILTTAFFRIAYAKGERPRWQWGRKE